MRHFGGEDATPRLEHDFRGTCRPAAAAGDRNVPRDGSRAARSVARCWCGAWGARPQDDGAADAAGVRCSHRDRGPVRSSCAQLSRVPSRGSGRRPAGPRPRRRLINPSGNRGADDHLLLTEERWLLPSVNYFCAPATTIFVQPPCSSSSSSSRPGGGKRAAFSTAWPRGWGYGGRGSFSTASGCRGRSGEESGALSGSVRRAVASGQGRGTPGIGSHDDFAAATRRLAASARKLLPDSSRITAWCTSRSMAQAVVIGSWKILSHSENTRLEVIATLLRS